MTRRVLFLGDLSRGDQAGNVARIERLFSPVCKQLGVDTSVVVSDVNRTVKLEEWLDDWRNSLGDHRASPISEVALDGAAVVGFEVPDRDLQYLNRHEVPWINLAIHPIRFLDDLYFEVTTSFGYDLRPHAASPGLIDLCVNVLRNKYARKISEPIPRTLVIIGQTPFDKSVYFDGEFHTLDHYLEALDRLAGEHDRVIYRSHPYLTVPEVDDLIYRRYDASSGAGANLYAMLIGEGVATACAISSSVISEVPHFGTRGVFLESRAKVFSDAISYRSLIDDLEFWGRAFLGVMPASRLAPMSRAVPANYLRDTFAAWGYVTPDEELKMRLNALADRVTQAESHITSAEAEARIAQADARAVQANARADFAESRATAAESRAQLAETRTREAELDAQESEARAQQAHALCGQLEARAQHAEAHAAQFEARANHAETELAALYRGRSWRYTKPLRAMFHVLRLVRDKTKGAVKAVLKPFVVVAIAFVQRHTWLKKVFSVFFRAVPRIEARVRSFIDTQRRCERQVAAAGDRQVGTPTALSAREQRIYLELRLAISRRE